MANVYQEQEWKKRKRESPFALIEYTFKISKQFRICQQSRELDFRVQLSKLVKQDRVEFSLSAFSATETIEGAMLFIQKVEKDRKSREEKGSQCVNEVRKMAGSIGDLIVDWNEHTDLPIGRLGGLISFFFLFFFFLLKTFLT